MVERPRDVRRLVAELAHQSVALCRHRIVDGLDAARHFARDLLHRRAEPLRRRDALSVQRLHQFAAAADDGLLDDAQLAVQLLAEVARIVAEPRGDLLPLRRETFDHRVAALNDRLLDGL